MEDAWDIHGTVAYAQALQNRGCDFIHVSSGGMSPHQAILMDLGPGLETGFAALVKRESGLPTIAVGPITEPKQAEHIPGSGQADMIALARQMSHNPRWASGTQRKNSAMCPPSRPNMAAPNAPSTGVRRGKCLVLGF